MIKFKAKTKGAHLTVRAKLSFDENINFAELDAFSRKLFKGFLKPKQTKKRMIEFTGPIGIPLYSRLQDPISKHDFFLIVEQVVECVKKLIKNKFSVTNVIWDINYVYINEATRELQLMYLPESSMATPGGLFEFFEALSYLTKPEPAPDTNFASNFLYFIRNQRYFIPAVIENYIQHEEPGAYNVIKKRATGTSGYMTDKQRDYLSHYEEDDGDEATGVLTDDDEATGLMTEEEATGLLDDRGQLSSDSSATDLLVDSAPVRYPTLLRVSTNETIQINKPVFRIGKEKSYVDYFVSNNSAVSRSHADIVTRGQRYYVIDLNSKNKTYINGQPLPVQQECELQNGNRLRLADEEFMFYI